MGFYTLRYLVELASLSLLGALPVQGGEATEKQLRDVGEGDGVAALDALGGELLEEVAEEEIDGLGGSGSPRWSREARRQGLRGRERRLATGLAERGGSRGRTERPGRGVDSGGRRQWSSDSVSDWWSWVYSIAGTFIFSFFWRDRGPPLR